MGRVWEMYAEARSGYQKWDEINSYKIDINRYVGSALRTVDGM